MKNLKMGTTWDLSSKTEVFTIFLINYVVFF